MASNKVIIFGPTGGVGSATALAAQKQGVKVFLAMRDTSKSIPQLSSSQEQAGGFERVEADLTKPDSVSAAVSKTGAKHAFIYLVFGSPDNLKSSIEALKSSGIEFVVFLSSFGIRGEKTTVQPDDPIAYLHAQVEIHLEEAFGPQGYVAVRPAYFASNSKRWKSTIGSGELKILYPDAKFDWISPEDIGTVCGNIVAGGWQAASGKTIVGLVGPQMTSQRDAVAAIGKGIGRELKVTEIDEETGLQQLLDSNVPKFIAEHLVKVQRERNAETDGWFEGPAYEEGVANVAKYVGREPTKFAEWVAKNKQDFE